MQGFLDIVLTECDRHASLQAGEGSDAGNQTSDHWGALFADEDELVATNNYNFLPVGSGPRGLNRISSKLNVRKGQNPRSLSLNPLHEFKHDRVHPSSITKAGSMRDVRQAGSPFASSTRNIRRKAHAEEAPRPGHMHASIFRRPAERQHPSDHSHGVRSDHDRALALKNLLVDVSGDSPVHGSPVHTHPPYIDKQIHKGAVDATSTSDPCRAKTFKEASSHESKSICRASGRSLKGMLSRDQPQTSTFSKLRMFETIAGWLSEQLSLPSCTTAVTDAVSIVRVCGRLLRRAWVQM